MIRFRYTFVLSVLLTTTALLGCEENLTARTHYDRPFTIYGVLSPDLDTQSVRIYALEDFPTLGSPSIDAVVTSKDLTTGEIRTWTDSVTVDPNGQYEHIFWSAFRAQYGHVYHIKVTRASDGAMSYAAVRVPAPVTVQLLNTDDPHLQVLIRGEGIRALTPEAEYAVRAARPLAPLLRYRVSYPGKEKQVGQGWLLTINMVIDRYLVQTWYTNDVHSGGIACPILELHELNLHALVGDSVWNPPEGRFDPKTLSQPGVLSNVQNGFGFIGGGYRIDVGLLPTQKAIEDACFVYYDPTR